jgi:hydrogenase nickel incorporation protein HypB
VEEIAVEFDESGAKRNIRAVPPGMQVFILSAKTGEGMADYLEFLERHRISSSATAGVST